MKETSAVTFDPEVVTPNAFFFLVTNEDSTVRVPGMIQPAIMHSHTKAHCPLSAGAALLSHFHSSLIYNIKQVLGIHG